MKYMITGTLSKDRKTVKAFLESKGWIEGTKTTADYLIVGDKPGSKLEYAIDNQITIIKEKHLVALLGPIEIKEQETEKELTIRIKKWMVKQVRDVFEFEGLTAEEFVMPYFYDWIRDEFDLKYDEVPEEVWEFDEKLQRLFKTVEERLKEEMKTTGFKLLDEININDSSVSQDYKDLEKYYGDVEDELNHLFGIEHDDEDLNKAKDGKLRVTRVGEDDIIDFVIGKNIVSRCQGDDFNYIVFWEEKKEE